MKYPKWWTDSITIYNKWIDEDKIVHYKRTVIKNCFFKLASTIKEEQGDVSSKRGFIVRIPQSGDYVDSLEWNETLEKFTLEIKEYVYNFYGKDYGTSGFSRYVYSIKGKDIANLSNLTFDDFLQYLKKEGYKFSSLEKDYWDSSGIPAYFFSGIPVKKFFELYFTSGKSHEEILRFLKDYDNAYNVDHDFIESEVEKILNKH